MKDNFQQWISWLLHRWRTQRNAIRNVNCRSVTHRNFERTLHLVVFRQVCLFECLCTLSLSFFWTLFVAFNRVAKGVKRKERTLVSLRKRTDFWVFAALLFNKRGLLTLKYKAQPGLFDGLALEEWIHVVSFCLLCLVYSWMLSVSRNPFSLRKREKHTSILLDLKSSKATRWT